MNASTMRCDLVGGCESSKCSHSDGCAVRFGQKRGSNVSKASSTEDGPLKVASHGLQNCRKDSGEAITLGSRKRQDLFCCSIKLKHYNATRWNASDDYCYRERG
jgi:hypothetical protein